MNVANASFNQMPFHQPIVTRSPNHMWASSWATTSATSCRSFCVAVAGSTSSRFSRNVMQPRFSIAPGGEVGQAEQVDLVARVRDAVVVLEPAQAERRDVEAERGEVALAGHVHDPDRDAVDVDPLGGLERADDERHEVRAHDHRVGEPHHDLAVGALGARRPRARSTRRAGRGSTTSVTPNTALKSGSSQHGNARRQSVDCIWVVAITLRRAVGVAVHAAVPAAELVVEDAAELDGERMGAVGHGPTPVLTNSRSVASSSRNVAGSPSSDTASISSSIALSTSSVGGCR